MRFLKLMLLAACVLASRLGIAQEVTVTVVSLFDREPVPQAAISSASGTLLGQTNAKGQVTFSVPQESGEVTITQPEYRTAELAISAGKTALTVELVPLRVLLPDFEVRAFESKLSEPSVTQLGTREFQRFDQTSVLEALNTVPGVKMDSRGAGGSRRISIRGSTLRSPFGVRNIKAYWQGIPISSPDGSTPLELFDAALVQQMQVIRGPGSSLYGAGNGGVLLFDTFREGNRPSVGTGMTIGAYGLLRNDIQLSLGNDTLAFQAAVVRHRSDGYREQEHLTKDQVLLQTRWMPNEQHRIAITGTFYEGEWGLPGALTAEQVAEDPTQAVEFSREGDASVYRRRVWMGASHTFAMKSGFSTETSAYLGHTDKTNPYGTSPFFNGYKREQAQGFGGRAVLRWKGQLANGLLQTLVGAESQTELLVLREYTNDLGNPGDQVIDAETVSDTRSAFAQADWESQSGWGIHAALSINSLVYDHTDLFDDGVDQSGRRIFDPVLTPRIGVQKRWNSMAAFARLSTGFSPPTLWEVVQQDGVLNRDLNAETGQNLEVGLNGVQLDQRLSWSLTTFAFMLNDAIIPRELESGVEVFENTGIVDQQGLEGSISMDVLETETPILAQIRPWLTGSWHRFQFQDYVKEGTDLGGNQLTGTPEYMLHGGLDIQSGFGLYLRPAFEYVSRIPLNDANEDWADAYTLVHLRMGYQHTVGDSWQLEGFAGINNLTDEQYSSFLQWNGFGGRYFNPSAPRNAYAGFRVTWLWN